MHLSRTLCSLCTAAALAFGSGRALAADPTESAVEANALTAKAGALYDEGVVAYKKGQWAVARASFLAAWSLKKHWQIAGNLADCELQLGKLRDAAEHAAYYLRTAPPDRRARAQALLDKAKAGTGTLAITVDQPGADVAVDGNVVGKSPLEDPVFVAPGRHQIEARSGARLASAGVDVLVGATVPVQLSPRDKGPDPVPPPERRSVVPGAVLGGLAGAAAITGIGLLIGSASKASSASTLHDAIAKTGSCTPLAPTYDQRCGQLASTSKDADTFHEAGVGVLIGAGVAAVGAGAYFLWPQRRASEAPAASVSLRVVPTASATGAGLVFLGAF